MAEQQQKRSPVIATLAAFCLATQLALLYGLPVLYRPFVSRCTGQSPRTIWCAAFAWLGLAFLLVGIGAFTGIVAWLFALFRAERRHDGLSALFIGVLPLVAFGNLLLVNAHAVGSLARVGAWALFFLLPVTLLATSVTSRHSIQRVVAVAALVLGVAVFVVSNLVD
jgi:hypothetical protein